MYPYEKTDIAREDLKDNFTMNVMREHYEAGMDCVNELTKLAERIYEVYAEEIDKLSPDAVWELFAEFFPEHEWV